MKWKREMKIDFVFFIITNAVVAKKKTLRLSIAIILFLPFYYLVAAAKFIP